MKAKPCRKRTVRKHTWDVVPWTLGPGCKPVNNVTQVVAVPFTNDPNNWKFWFVGRWD